MTLDNHHCVQLVPLFEKLAEQDLTRVEKIVEHKKIKKGEIIISPDKEPLLVIVAQGALKISQLSQSGKEQLLRIIEAGDYEGEGALLGVTNGQLYGQAMIDSTICFLRQSDFETLLTTYPSLSLQLLKLNAKKYLAAEHQAGFLALDDVEARLAHYFLNLSATSDSIYFEIPMKLKELANYIGTSPETISRKIKVFEENKIISRQGRMIKLLDKEKLEDDFA